MSVGVVHVEAAEQIDNMTSDTFLSEWVCVILFACPPCVELLRVWLLFLQMQAWSLQVDLHQAVWGDVMYDVISGSLQHLFKD